ncbi:MAG: hypothetical protein ACXVXD_14820, partial [Nocardioidaceae bacterium]
MTETPQQSAVRYERDADGIVVLTLDDPTSSANTMNELYQQSMGDEEVGTAHTGEGRAREAGRSQQVHEE